MAAQDTAQVLSVINNIIVGQDKTCRLALTCLLAQVTY